MAEMTLAALMLACSSSSSSGPSPKADASVASPTDTGPEGLSIVALGDSDTTGAGDPTGKGWVGRYADLVRDATNRQVEALNLAVDGKTSDQLLADVRSDPTTRQALSKADIVLIGIGGADLNAGDERLEAGTCGGRACYIPIMRRFRHNLDAVVATVRRLGGSRAVLRAMSLPNGYPGAGSAFPPSATATVSLYQAETERDIVCDTMAKFRGRCVDVVRAFNGPSGTDDAYKAGLMTKQECCYPSAKGQQLIARLLLKTGLAPLKERS
jgi:lysophospholipase L1-like esterase